MFGGRPCEATHISLFRLGAQPIDLRAHLLAQDVIYVGGGSMRNLLAIWRAHGIDDILVEAWRRGTVLAGVSAGAMCWFTGGVTTSSGVPSPARGLGLLPGSLSVHLDAEPERRPVFVEAVRAGVLQPGYAVDDGAALLFCDGRLVRVVSARPKAGAIRVEADGSASRLDAHFWARGGPRRGRLRPTCWSCARCTRCARCGGRAAAGGAFARVGAGLRRLQQGW